MDAELIFAVCWGVSFFILGIVVLLGIADELMAGYNTASEEERKKYNIVFLRINMTIICWATAALVPAIAFWGKSYKHAIGVAHLMVVIACCVIANVWGKRK